MPCCFPTSLWRCRALWLLALSALALSRGANAFAGGPHAAVPGFERFFADAKADAAAGGQLLLGELNCTSCHRADVAQAALFLPRQAPTLDGVGGRVKRSFLRRFLGDPHAVKPGTAMPDVFAGVP